MIGKGAAWRKRLLMAAVGLLLGIQLVPVDRTNPPVDAEVLASAQVKAILVKACFDCHSHKTRWPWYSRVAPLSWGIAHHIHEGREDLNFSRWPILDFERQDLMLREIAKQLKKGAMPLREYTWLHPEARLSASERRVLLVWAESTQPGNGPAGTQFKYDDDDDKDEDEEHSRKGRNHGE